MLKAVEELQTASHRVNAGLVRVTAGRDAREVADSIKRWRHLTAPGLGQRRAQGVGGEPLEPGAVVRVHGPAGVQREAVAPRAHRRELVVVRPTVPADGGARGEEQELLRTSRSAVIERWLREASRQQAHRALERTMSA